MLIPPIIKDPAQPDPPPPPLIVNSPFFIFQEISSPIKKGDTEYDSCAI